jgi:hypothetical protein
MRSGAHLPALEQVNRLPRAAELMVQLLLLMDGKNTIVAAIF